MRLSPSLIFLPALVAAQQQVPLKEQLQGWFDKAKSYLPTNAPAAAAPAATPAAPDQAKAPPVLSEKPVTPLTMANWQSVLAPVEPGTPDTEREWLVFITGGNKTCFGHCLRADEAFNKSLPLFAADPTSPSIARLNCEKDNLVCAIWSTGPPSVWHIQLPVKAEADQPKPKTPIHTRRLNITTVTAEEVYKIHSEKLWKQRPEHHGAFHPMDGWLAEYGLNIVLGSLIYGFNLVPSWLMMIAISFFSRTIMSRRMNSVGGAPPAQASGAQ